MSFRVLSLFASAFFFAACSTTPSPKDPVSFTLKREAVTGEKAPFLTHENYLAMNLEAGPFLQLHDELVNKENTRPLISRGEAHITVVTPPEFDVLKDKLTIEDLNQIANEFQIENSLVEPICVGLAQAILDGVEEQTYYVVVTSNDLLRLRHTIEILFRTRGGTGDFQAEHFLPHVTVGFTKRDLFEADGAIKDAHSCIGQLSQ